MCRSSFPVLLAWAHSIGVCQGDHNASKPYRQELHNIGDVQYTGDIEIGGQVLRAILDTGSFELLVLSKECHVCGDPEKLYDSEESDEYHEGKNLTQHNFGSGATLSIQAYDTVRVGPLEARRQPFWQVFDAEMPILEESTFAVIVGVGPPGSAERISEDKGYGAPVVLDRGSLRGVPEGRAMNLSANVSVDMRPTSSICSSFDVRTISVCIGEQQGSPGYFVWNDIAPWEQGRQFTQVPVAGEIYWAVKMTSVRTAGDKSTLACADGCAAIIDSGTSLIAAPSEVIWAVEAMLGELKEDCSNLEDLPHLTFELGGKIFSLPPDAYIGQIINKDAPGLSDILHFHTHSRRHTCVPLFMNMDVASQLGPMWILGLPFFRKYYTTFSVDTSGPDVKKYMSMALADDDCKPAESDTLLERPRRKMLPRKVDLSQLRVPRWVEEFSAQKRVRV